MVPVLEREGACALLPTLLGLNVDGSCSQLSLGTAPRQKSSARQGESLTACEA